MQQQANAVKQRQAGFLQGLANWMAKRGTPLPPALTGIPTPNYDPSSPMWQFIEPSTTDIGSFRLAGKDVNLFKLWTFVLQHGGGASLTANNNWGALLPHLDLPDEFVSPQTSNSTSVAHLLGQHYHAILQPFEDVYKQNMHDQKRAQMAMRANTPGQPGQQNMGRAVQGMPGGAQPNLAAQLQRGGMGNSIIAQQGNTGGLSAVNSNVPYPQAPQTPQPPHQRPTSSMNNIPQAPIQPGLSVLPDATIQPALHADTLPDQGIKRKLDPDDDENKRARQKTAGSEPPDNPATSMSIPGRSAAGISAPAVQGAVVGAANRPRTQPSRRKIEYVPYARELDTYGGRDLRLIEAETITIPQRRPIRDIGDWGTVDVEALTMSIRSRLSTELSYALTTFTILSTMRGQQPGSGFPIHQCPDLFEELLDLLQEQGFGDVDAMDVDLEDEAGVPLLTNRALLNLVSEEESLPFAALEHNDHSLTDDSGLVQKPNHIILTVINIIRNLCVIHDNHPFISQNDRLLDLLLQLCAVSTKGGNPRAISPALSIGDVVAVRKHVLQVLVNVAGGFTFTRRVHLKVARRLIQLLASYLVDPLDSVSPFSYLQLNGSPQNANQRPPPLVDMALEALTRLSQSDTNRQVIAQVVPSELLWQLFTSLVHRLPVTDADFQLVTREAWLSYLEKNIMAMYSIAFLAPPELKRKAKTDRKLGLKGIMFRMLQKFLMQPNPESRMWFLVCTRRSIETMKVLDDGEDLFDTPNKTALPLLSFGMGYGEAGDIGSEKGTGLLGGHRDVTWELLMHREVFADEVMFGELESLARVE
ncbi:hypothetical protein BDN72DRAFT_908964 [Pluteus cervinus]|uniref:Uncharacterized protein n=1 Tax=Pluteus cervinus TaxID=181527 RepID=A0ACD3BIN9_9AGAR|nr:hypothetical protein BDN72DRAFT_908964 [Pluteus cervinus]